MSQTQFTATNLFLMMGIGRMPRLRKLKRAIGKIHSFQREK